MFIAKACNEVNPEEFFIASSPEEDGNFYPDRGDIVLLSGKKILVLTREGQNKSTHSITGVCLVDEKAVVTTLATITYVRSVPKLIEKVDKEYLNDVLNQIRELFC